jgi:predicted transcriptional regulator
MTTRLNVNVNDETAAALHELAERRGVTVTEVVRRAVAALKFLEDEVVCPGQSIELMGRGRGATRAHLG